MNRKILLSSLLASVLLFPAIFWTLSVIPVLADPEEAEPVYVGVAKYYDNRTCVVTSTHDDLCCNASWWENCLSMLTEKKIYHTVAIITNHSVLTNDWDYVQYWVDQGYTEAGSHSRNHVHVPYNGTDPYTNRSRISYEWQINGSKNDIIGNLTLPKWWRYSDKEYVYAWIEPYGSCDETVRQWLGDCHYLCDRDITNDSVLATWDSANGLFQRVGYTIEMGSPPWGGVTSVSSLNGLFDIAYNGSKIYHLTTHPYYVNWSEGSYADQHTDYISNRTDVWYVPFGLLYLYHWVDVRNIVNVTSTGSELNKVFKLSINATDHLNYGVSYPITYVFDIPSNWTSGYVYYRYLETDPWVLMENKSSQDFFNGVYASRFDFSNHKAYVSVGFSNVSHEIYLQLRPKPRNVIGISSVTTSKTIVGQGYSLDIHVTTVNYGVATETFNVTTYINTTAIQTKNVTLTGGNSTTITFTCNTTGVPYGNYTISAYAHPVPGETDTADNTYTDGTVKIIKHTVAAFIYSPTTPLTNETITFNASLSTPDGGTIIGYEWDFGDGTNATGIIATHAYTDNGTYTVTLTVTDDDELTDTDSQNITVLNRPPVVSFTESATTVPTGTVINFNASASYDPDGSIVSYFWDFGDGENATGVTVNHAYLDNGTYIVTLTVTDDDGATASTTANKTVLNRPDIAVTNVTPSKTVVGQSYSLQINVTVTNEGDYTETFNVTVYANTTIIDTFTNVTLTSGSSTNLTFTWNTTGFAYGNYTISAYAHPVPGETDTTDNTHVDGTVVVIILGDFDGDGDVDLSDFWVFMGSYLTNPPADPRCDFDGDGDVDLSDFYVFTRNYGKSI